MLHVLFGATRKTFFARSDSVARAAEREGQRVQFAPGPQAPRASSTNIKIFVIASLYVFKEHPNRSSL